MAAKISPKMLAELLYSARNGYQGTMVGVGSRTEDALITRGLITYDHNVKANDGGDWLYPVLTPAGWAAAGIERLADPGRWTLEQCFSDDGWHQVGTQELAYQMARPLDVNQALCEVMRLAEVEEDGHAEAKAYLTGAKYAYATEPTADERAEDLATGKNGLTVPFPAEGDLVELVWKTNNASGFRSKATGWIDGIQRPDSISYRLPEDDKPGTRYSSVYRHVVDIRVLATVEEQKRPDRLTLEDALAYLPYGEWIDGQWITDGRMVPAPFRLDWQPGRYADFRGMVNGQTLVCLAWKSRRTDPNYLITTTLPIPIPRTVQGHDDLKTAQKMAEGLVTDWLDSIGAQWKPVR